MLLMVHHDSLINISLLYIEFLDSTGLYYIMFAHDIILNSFKSIYRSFHIFNCRQLFRTSGPHQYSALNKKFHFRLLYANRTVEF